MSRNARCNRTHAAAVVPAALLALLFMSSAAAREVSLAEQIRRVADLDRLMRPPQVGERSVIASGTADAGAVAETLLVRVDGPAVVTRLWVEKPTGTLRLVIDGRVAIDGAWRDFFGGAIAPLGEPLTYRIALDGPGVNYFPIGCNESLELHSAGLSGAYQADITRFDAPTAVAPFAASLPGDAHDALESVATALRHGITESDLRRERKLSPYAAQEDLPPGAHFGASASGAGTIRAVHVSVTDRSEPRELNAMHRCVLRVYFDGQQTPSVEAPLSAFFGAGFNRYSASGLPAGTDRWSDMPGESPLESWLMYALWPMPFRDGARLELHNDTSKKIGLMLYVLVDRQPPGPRALRFHARYVREPQWDKRPVPALDVAGRGRWVGLTLLSDSTDPGAWTDGASVAVDGDAPSPLAGGLASFLGCALPPAVGSFALHGVPHATWPGKTTAHRWRVADSVPFQKSLRVSLPAGRCGPGAFGSAVAYWYADAEATARVPQWTDETLDLPPLRVAGAAEVEGAIQGDGWGSIVQQRHAGGVELSGQAAARITTTDPVLCTLRARSAGRYRLSLRVHPSRSFERIRIETEAGVAVGSVEYRRTEDGVHSVGAVDLVEGINTLRVTCSKPVTLDCWILEPIAP